MRNVILIDLDDTVSAAWRREHLIPDWDAYHTDLINDEPIPDTLALIEALSWKGALDNNSPELVACTARPEKWRRLSMEWLVKYDVALDGLLMRPDHDFRPAPAVKIDLAAEYCGGHDKIAERVALVIDDREDIVKEFAGLGVTTLLINARRVP